MLIVVADDVELGIEGDLQTSRKFDFPSVGVALDLPDELPVEEPVLGNEIGNLLRNDSRGNRSVLALDALPRPVGAEVTSVRSVYVTSYSTVIILWSATI